MRPNDSGNGGIYIHVPFCLKKCAYCNFYSVSNAGLIDAYVKALCREVEFAERTVTADVFTPDTVYFGGGTPSMLTPQQVGGILETVRQSFALSPTCEITLEVNPATADLAKLRDYRELGVNRLSIGMQSFDDTMLKMLGRAHNAADSLAVFDDARKAGFDNISVDLIYGLPGQTEAQLMGDLQQILALKAEHISAYMLTLEPDTLLARKLEQGAYPALSEDFQRQAFDLVLETLAVNGYQQYEISNFARKTETTTNDFRSRHNLKYWNFAPYLGFGPAAHSFYRPNKRAWNVNDVATYLELIAQNKLPGAEAEILTTEQILMEMVYLGLRQNRGIDIAAFDKVCEEGFANVCAAALEVLLNTGMVALNGDFCALTDSGRPFLDYVTQTLVNNL